MMAITKQCRSLRMLRASLDGVPEHPVPPDLRVHWYRPGDAAWWARVHADADAGFSADEATFRAAFGHDDALIGARQFYFVDESDRPVATTTAWFNDDFEGGAIGRVHFVAVARERQGRGLSKSLLSFCCARLRALGHDRVYLVTDTMRLRAINLYLQFGFVPYLAGDEDGRLWSQLRDHVRPAWRDRLPA